MSVIKEYFRLKKALSESEYSRKNIAELKTELAHYNNKLGYTTQSGISNQSRLLGFITEFCNNRKVRISLIPQGNVQEKNGYSVETNPVQLEGDFKQIVELIYQIEQVQKLAKVASADFETKEDWILKTRRLTATIYFQNIQTK